MARNRCMRRYTTRHKSIHNERFSTPKKKIIDARPKYAQYDTETHWLGSIAFSQAFSQNIANLDLDFVRYGIEKCNLSVICMGFIFAFFVLCLIINSNILSVFVNASKVFTTLMALVINLQSKVETFQEALSLVKLMPIFASFLFSINTLSASRWLKQGFNRGRLLLFFFL